MNKVLVKWLLIISALLFMDWLIMIFLGCFSSMCLANEKFYCSVYCYIGITLLTFTLLIIGYLLLRQCYRSKSKI